MKDIQILRGNPFVESAYSKDFWWPAPYTEEREISFAEAYQITREDDYGIRECEYTVQGRTFKDLSFAEGETILKPDIGRITSGEEERLEIRKHSDGTIFLYLYERVPTFDSSDREWGSERFSAVYRKDNSINLIHTYCGYKIGSIEIYLGLVKSVPALDELLKYI